jgi:hypothetical protein
MRVRKVAMVKCVGLQWSLNYHGARVCTRSNQEQEINEYEITRGIERLRIHARRNKEMRKHTKNFKEMHGQITLC